MTRQSPGTRLLRGRHLLLLNWRDTLDPQAGGAEVFCWAMASRFAAAGASVTLLCGKVPGRAPEEMRQGVRVVRRGGRFGVYGSAARFMLRNRSRFDAVVEFENGIPFFAPLFVRRGTPVIRLMHHVHQEQFRQHFRWPLSEVGRFLESGAARAVFGSRPVAVVSPSTRSDVRNVLGVRGPLHVIPNGSRPSGAAGSRADRAVTPTLVSVGRLSKHKRIDLLLTTTKALLRDWPELHVDIVGAGSELISLQAQARDLDITDAVEFHGFVSQEAREAIVAQAWLAVIPSDGEGWCLSVIEAKAAGVPVAGRSVAGLRDSIRPGITGWLASSEEDLPRVVGQALHDVKSISVAEHWAQRCRDWAAQYRWDDSADRLAAVIADEMVLQTERGGDDRRDLTDVSCVIEVEIDSPERFVRAVESGLRRGELVSLEGSTACLLLNGCDERHAVACLRRLGFPRVTAARVSRGFDLLVGPPAPVPAPARRVA